MKLTERHTFFQLPVTYRTASDYPRYATTELTVTGIEPRTFRLQGLICFRLYF